MNGSPSRRGSEAKGSLGLRLASSFFLVGEASPVAPATVACLVLTPLLYPYLLAPWGLQVALALLATAAAIPISTRAERIYGHDGRAIVADEVVGMLVTFVAMPSGTTPGAHAVVLALGFFIFRFMDVVKPFPAGRLQRLPGGWGVVMDDFAAGIYANLVLRLLVDVG